MAAHESTGASQSVSRRHFLTNTSLAAAATAAVATAGSSAMALSERTLAAQDKPAQPPQRPLRVAAIHSIYRFRSHAYHISGRLIHGYEWNGFLHQPACRVVRMYNDQSPKDDMGPDVCQRHGIELCKTPEETLGANGGLDVDAVLIIVEHGDYPLNERQQILYPRYEMFERVAEVFRKAGRSVPVFVDKHLSYDYEKAAKMVATAKTLGFPLMAGSSLPVTWRRPDIEPPLETPFEEGLVCFGYDRGPAEIYFFHALEVLQSMLERRTGGETGVKKVECLRGEAVWQAGDAGRWSWKLLQAALKRCPSLNVGPIRENVRDPVAILIEYADGTRGAALNLIEQVSDFGFAGSLKNTSDPFSTYFHLPPPPGARFFDPLTWNIEQHFLNQRSPYPAERTLLTSTVLDWGLRSLAEKGRVIEHPSLQIRYQPPVSSGFARGGETNLVSTTAFDLPAVGR